MQAEKAISTAEKCKPSAVLRKNKEAMKYYKRLVKILGEIELNEAFYENVLGRYCILLAEHDAQAEERRRAEGALDELYKRKTELHYEIFLDQLKTLSGVVIACDKAIAKKRDQLLAIERENLMTIQGKLRAIPKKAEQKELSGIAAYMQRRDGG